jgi:hypothetical protein
MLSFRHCGYALLLMIISSSALCAMKQRGEFSLDLGGQWSLAVDSGAAFSAETVKERGHWRQITVPGSWQAQNADLRDYQGVAWYRRSFEAPKIRRGESVILAFGAVDYRCAVFVNGKSLGSHEGGYTPFQCDVSAAVREGSNEILVRVMDPVLSDGGTEGIQYKNIPHGKQNWYVQTSGIWQGVRIFAAPPRRITGVELLPSISGTIEVKLRIANPVQASAHNRVSLRILDGQGKSVAQLRSTVEARDSAATFTLSVNGPALWSPDNPVLYQVEAVLDANAPVRDRFGFRSIETRDGKILLNGHPFYLIGALDQDFYPVEVYTTPSESYIRDEMLKAKKIGLNTLRCHIKAPDAVYLKVADEVGLLVWYEIPNWDVWTPETGKRGEQTLRDMVARDWNHPSLVILSIINESWGINLKEKQQREWLRNAFDRMKDYARGRLVVDNSACSGNFHMKSDLNDYHTYCAMPDQHGEFDSVLADMATRPAWLFSPHGDAVTTRKEPILLSEFGTWGLPQVPHPEPWWIGRTLGISESVRPKGYEERFVGNRLHSVFGSYREMLGVSQRAQTDALKYQIEQLRFTPGIEGYVITEFTDINWECNGVLDMWRNIKDCGRVLPSIQQQDVVVPRPVKRSWWSDENPAIEVRCSRYSSESVAGVTVYWRTSRKDSGSVVLGAVPEGTVSVLPALQLPKPGVLADNTLKVDVRMVSGTGRVLAGNSTEFSIYPHDAIRGSDAALPVMITSQFDSTALTALQEGKDVVLLMDSTTVFPAGFPAIPVRRDTGGYSGDWASALYWARTERAPFRGLDRDHRLAFEIEGMKMPYALRLRDAAHFDDVLAGMFIGWVQKNAAFVVQMNVGKGKLIVCAFPLHWTSGTDPYSAMLLSNLKRYIASSDCRPAWEWIP